MAFGRSAISLTDPEVLRSHGVCADGSSVSTAALDAFGCETAMDTAPRRESGGLYRRMPGLERMGACDISHCEPRIATRLCQFGVAAIRRPHEYHPTRRCRNKGSGSESGKTSLAFALRAGTARHHYPTAVLIPRPQFGISARIAEDTDGDISSVYFPYLQDCDQIHGRRTSGCGIFIAVCNPRQIEV